MVDRRSGGGKSCKGPKDMLGSKNGVETRELLELENFKNHDKFFDNIARMMKRRRTTTISREDNVEERHSARQKGRVKVWQLLTRSDFI